MLALSHKARPPMRPNIAQVRIVWLIFFLLTSSIAKAAEPVLLLPDGIPAFQYMFAFLLSAMGGMANGLKKWANGFETANVKTSIASDAVSSVCAGFIAFFGALHYRPPSAIAVIVIFIFAYGGSRLLDLLYSKSEYFLSRKIDKEAEK